MGSGAKRIVVGVGGTASTDGGTAVSTRSRQARFHPIWTSSSPPTSTTRCLGPAGAARSFGPQKGAPGRSKRWSSASPAWASSGELDPATPGAGAGGGLAYGLMRLGARRSVGLPSSQTRSASTLRCSGVDLVVTGEGGLDFSSLRGKVVASCRRTRPGAGPTMRRGHRLLRRRSP